MTTKVLFEKNYKYEDVDFTIQLVSKVETVTKDVYCPSSHEHNKKRMQVESKELRLTFYAAIGDIIVKDFEESKIEKAIKKLRKIATEEIDNLLEENTESELEKKMRELGFTKPE